MDTETLIARLSAEAQPVRPLMPPWRRAAIWLAICVPPLVAVVALHGLSIDAAGFLADQRLLIEELAILATAISAAVAAFASVVPGRSQRWLWLPAIPLAIWLATVGKGCLDDFAALGPAGLRIRVDVECFLPMVMIGTLPAIAIVMMLRGGAPLRPRVTLVLAALATAAVANAGLRLFHAGDISIKVLVWHFGLIGVLLAVAAAAGPTLLPWRKAAAAT